MTDPRHGWILNPRAGAPLYVRPARQCDLDAVLALHHRCSLTTTYRRYLTPMSRPPRRMLGQLLATGHCELAFTPAGSVVAMGNLCPLPEADGGAGAAEVALLVEDGWQRRGIGSALLRRLAEVASAQGYQRLHALTLAETPTIVGMHRRLGPTEVVAAGETIAVSTSLRGLGLHPGDRDVVEQVGGHDLGQHLCV